MNTPANSRPWAIIKIERTQDRTPVGVVETGTEVRVYRHGMSTDVARDAWIPEACTLPTADQPLRVAEFETFFTEHLQSINRRSRTELRLSLDGHRTTEEEARELAARETACCGFFTFRINRSDGTVRLDIEVPAAHVCVLDGLERLAHTAAPQSLEER